MNNKDELKDLVVISEMGEDHITCQLKNGFEVTPQKVACMMMMVLEVVLDQIPDCDQIAMEKLTMQALDRAMEIRHEYIQFYDIDEEGNFEKED